MPTAFTQEEDRAGYPKNRTETSTGDIIRLQERMRMMESMVGELRGDIKEIKVAVNITAGKGTTWKELFQPMIGAIWAVGGALLMLAIVGQHH